MTNNIPDNIHGSIQYSKLEKELFTRPEFNRLRKILQSGNLYLTFPSNQTKRYEHSLGVMHISGQIFFYSLSNAKKETLLKFIKISNKTIKEVTKKTILADRDLINQIFSSSFISELENCIENENKCIFNDIFDKYIKNNDLLYTKYVPKQILDIIAEHEDNKSAYWVYILLFQAIRITGCLHDIGHLPYSHSSEEALKRIFKYIENNDIKNTKRSKNFLKIYKELDKKKKPIHEIVSDKIVDSIYKSLLTEIIVDNSNEINAQNLFNIIVFQIVKNILGVYAKRLRKESKILFNSLHSIIAGVIDSDRLDFVNRDTYNSGKYSFSPDYQAIINSFTLIIKNYDNIVFKFLPNIKAFEQIEHFFNIYWDIYDNINYNPRSVKMNEILIQSIENISIIYLSDEKLDTEECNQSLIQKDISGLWRNINSILSLSIEKSVNYIIQWDDSWIDNCLRESYFKYKEELKKIKNKTLEKKDSLLFNPYISEYINAENMLAQLYELISNKKQYSSIIKNRANYNEVDKQFKKNLLKKIKELLNEFDQNKQNENKDIALINDLIKSNNLLNEKISQSLNNLNLLLNECINNNKSYKETQLLLIKEILESKEISYHSINQLFEYYLTLSLKKNTDVKYNKLDDLYEIIKEKTIKKIKMEFSQDNTKYNNNIYISDAFITFIPKKMGFKKIPINSEEKENSKNIEITDNIEFVARGDLYDDSESLTLRLYTLYDARYQSKPIIYAYIRKIHNKDENVNKLYHDRDINYDKIYSIIGDVVADVFFDNLQDLLMN